MKPLIHPRLKMILQVLLLVLLFMIITQQGKTQQQKAKKLSPMEQSIELLLNEIEMYHIIDSTDRAASRLHESTSENKPCPLYLPGNGKRNNTISYPGTAADNRVRQVMTFDNYGASRLHTVVIIN